MLNDTLDRRLGSFSWLRIDRNRCLDGNKPVELLDVPVLGGDATLASALDALTDEFDAIICDIALPDGTGYAVISEAKRLNNNVLGIALSGYSSRSDIDIGRMAGFDYHLTKPFDCAKIRLLLAKAAPRPA